MKYAKSPHLIEIENNKEFFHNERLKFKNITVDFYGNFAVSGYTNPNSDYIQFASDIRPTIRFSFKDQYYEYKMPLNWKTMICPLRRNFLQVPKKKYRNPVVELFNRLRQSLEEIFEHPSSNMIHTKKKVYNLTNNLYYVVKTATFTYIPITINALIEASPLIWKFVTLEIPRLGKPFFIESFDENNGYYTHEMRPVIYTGTVVDSENGLYQLSNGDEIPYGYKAYIPLDPMSEEVQFLSVDETFIRPSAVN